MCGIAGLVNSNQYYVTRDRLKVMTDQIAHRGPDGEGHWVSENGKVGFGHRRLSIIDLSHGGDQPMHYLERYTITFNGEIYNYIELRHLLEKKGYRFESHSDTEVLLALYAEYKQECLQLLDGMFAFAIYDVITRTIFCARDRFGEKPFFYAYEKGRHFCFASEMKAFWAIGIEKQVCPVMLFNYLNEGFLSNPSDVSETFYQGIYRLPHSHYIMLNADEIVITTTRYFDIDWRNTDESITEKDAEEKLNELFFDSVSRRLRSDVPVGSSLSGGLDSSIVVCAIDHLIKASGQQQDTFSAVFPGFKKDESRYIQVVTEHTNVNPNYITPADRELLEDFEKLTFYQEEPFGSASIYVQYRVMQLAKEKGITVLLDGQGADEILAGYHGYYTTYFDALLRKEKGRYRKEKDAYFQLHADNAINELQNNSFLYQVKDRFPTLFFALQKKYHKRRKQQKPDWMCDDFYNAYRKSAFHLPRPAGLEQELYIHTMHYGLQELLRYADRNSMAHSREVRLPFLNHRLVEFVFSLPAHYKIRDGWTKWIQRKAFEDLIPRSIAWRKDKIGYAPPQDRWMQSTKIKNMISSQKQLLMKSGILKDGLNNEAQDWRLLSLMNVASVGL